MRNANLIRAFAPFRATGLMWAVDKSTGAVRSLPLVQYTMIVGTGEASIYRFFPAMHQEYAEQARVLAGIAGRN